MKRHLFTSLLFCLTVPGCSGNTPENELASFKEDVTLEKIGDDIASAKRGNIVKFWDIFTQYETSGQFAEARPWLLAGVKVGEPRCTGYYINEIMSELDSQPTKSEKLASLAIAKSAFERASKNIQILDEFGRTTWDDRGKELDDLINSTSKSE